MFSSGKSWMVVYDQAGGVGSDMLVDVASPPLPLFRTGSLMLLRCLPTRSLLMIPAWQPLSVAHRPDTTGWMLRRQAGKANAYCA